MSTKALDCIEIATSESVDHSVVWLHGLGASGHDFEPVVPALELLSRPGVRFVFPHAPVRPITVNGGAAMRAWYDIDSLDFESRDHDGSGIRESAAAVGSLIEREIERGVPAANIVLAGFSQGGAIALYAGYAGAHRLGGILALSTYLPLQSEVLPGIDDARREVPLLMCHGVADEVVPLRAGERSRSALEASGAAIDWRTYPIGHNVSAQEVAEIGAWMRRLFGM